MLEKLGGSFENEVRGPPVIMNPRPAQNQNPNVVPGPEVIDDNTRTDDSSDEESDDNNDDKTEDMDQDNEETEQAPNAQIENRNNKSFELFFRDASDSDSD